MRARDPSYRARARSLSRRATPRRHTARACSPRPLFPSALRSARALSARAPLARSTSRSFLSYGVGTVEESLRARLLSDAAGRPGVVENPCAFRGHEADAPGGARLVGTGDLPRCEAALRDVLWNGTCAAPPCGSIPGASRGAIGTDTSIMHESAASAATVPMDAVDALFRPFAGGAEEGPCCCCCLRFADLADGDAGGVRATAIACPPCGAAATPSLARSRFTLSPGRTAYPPRVDGAASTALGVLIVR